MDYSIANICSPHKSLKVLISMKPVKIPYFTHLEVQSSTETIFERTSSDFSVCKDFMKIQEIPDSKIELLKIGGCVFNKEEFLDRLIEALCKNNLKIQTETIHFHMSIEGLILKHVELLRNFDSERLYGIEINTPMSDDVLKEMTRTEQWKKAKRLTIFVQKEAKSMDIEDFLNFEKIYLIDYPKISKEDCWKIIQSFRHRDIPSGSFFKITETGIDVTGVLELYDVPPKCEEKDSVYVQHIQHFVLENTEDILEVRLYEDQIWGRRGKKDEMNNY